MIALFFMELLKKNFGCGQK